MTVATGVWTSPWLFASVVLAGCGGANGGSTGLGSSTSSGGGRGDMSETSGSGSGSSGGSSGSSSGTPETDSGSGSSSGSSGGSGSGSGGSSGGSNRGAGADGGGDSGGGVPGTCFAPVTDFAAAGPFTATSGDVASVGCTITRPTVLGAGGCLNPVIVWGNGTGTAPTNYTLLFNHFASQGFIVAAADTSNAGSGKEMLACLQYMIDQNGTAGSPYQGHVDVKNVASSGWSQGGAGCLEAGLDPRFKVTAPVSPYVVFALGGYDETSAMKQAHPMFLISGSDDMTAVPAQNQQPIFDQAKVSIVWGTHAGSTHFEVENTGGAYAGPLTAWFRYKLMGDATAGKWFEKPPCTLCSTSGWTVQFK